MEEEHEKYHQILLTRKYHYVWRFPEGTPGNYKIRDPERPRASICNLWHKVKMEYTVDQKKVTEEFWER